MIYAYLILVIGLSIVESKNLYDKGQTKDMFVFLGSMIFVAAFGVFFFLSNIRFSIAGIFLNLM